ncbi:hypothetical protein [Acidithiobacillus sp. AMEEHan]|uniref:hypothetical protein n=1 Tax=Acidithiobacillus sp. AMEEHan TaxID=2994951 RepID=UPI0027E408C8|nr:hypothetical protein [Acidithiobacillus sp. AMEEHan]
METSSISAVTAAKPSASNGVSPVLDMPTVPNSAGQANPSSSTPAADKKAGQVQQAVQKLQEKVATTQPSITLEAGLDPNGEHPNQVLIQLSDKMTKQVFFSYYVPAEQVAKAAESENPVGLLLQNKA